jgi:hypothetical protein
MLSYKTCVCYLIYLKEKEMKAEEKEKHNLSLSFLEKQSNMLLYSIDLLVSTMIIEWCGEVRNNKQTTLSLKEILEHNACTLQRTTIGKEKSMKSLMDASTAIPDRTRL